jgi:hypothetical protein
MRDTDCLVLRHLHWRYVAALAASCAVQQAVWMLHVLYNRPYGGSCAPHKLEPVYPSCFAEVFALHQLQNNNEKQLQNNNETSLNPSGLLLLAHRACVCLLCIP